MGKLVGQTDIPLTMPLNLRLGGGIVCGADTGSPLWDGYKPRFRFSGTLYGVTVDVSGELIKDPEAELRRYMVRQQASAPVRKGRSENPGRSPFNDYARGWPLPIAPSRGMPGRRRFR
jgi:hypothetical protein